MADVVCLALPQGPDLVTALQQVWAAGDAAFPLDPRLPAPERAAVMATIAPTAVIEADGERRSLHGGVPTRPGDALVLATSGTSGAPKGVVLTHDAIRASAIATSAALAVDPARDRWIACLPVAHIGGLSVITRALLTDTPVEVHPVFDATAVLEAADRGATLVSLVTRALAEVPSDRFRRILLGGAAPPPDRPANVIATYGMTETGSGVVYERRPIDGVELRIDDEEQIWVRGPMLLRAYRDAAGLGTAATTDEIPSVERHPLDDEGWFATGDLGGFADDGSLRVFGRAGDVIITGGEKVWPERLEPHLRRHPAVAAACVVGRPHPEWGHEVIAVVELTDGASPPSLEELRSSVRSALPVWYAPRGVLVVDDLPRTTLGKVRRREVAAALSMRP